MDIFTNFFYCIRTTSGNFLEIRAISDTPNFFLCRLTWQELEANISKLLAKQVRIGKKIQTVPFPGD
jgi:hypothetical protein